MKAAAGQEDYCKETASTCSQTDFRNMLVSATDQLIFNHD